MIKNKILSYITISLFGTAILGGCTNLDEELYDKVTAETFIQTKEDVYRVFLRSFEHGYWTVQGAQFVMQENTADQIMTPSREGDWFDGGVYIRAHNHTWTTQDWYVNDGWLNLSTGVVQATNSLEDLQNLDVTRFGMSVEEQRQLIAELRVMRAWYNLRLFDFYRNVEIITAVRGVLKGKEQATPEEMFAFIENEITESVGDLRSKGDPGTDKFDGRWTKAGAMALLARLYLNAEVYIGQNKYAECATICQDIIAGKYGNYSIESRWDAPFDWNNNQSSETIFAFPGTFGRSHWHYDTYRNMLHYNANKYLGFDDWGGMNPQFALQPGRNVDSVEYAFELGKPFIKFQNYPDDVRLKKYTNTGTSAREGMFLYGYLTYNDNKDTVKTTRGYNLFIRDQVGWFKALKPGQSLSDKESNMNHADQNSGIYPVKYPFYATSSSRKIEADYAEIRLAEIYYTLAECRFRAGDKAEASRLLNVVRSRYYPAGSASLYDEGGSELTEQELLDEWGREFVAEGRRRTDLIRFDKFTKGRWWDKEPDASDHLKIFPIGQRVLNINPQLKQNLGY